MGPGPADRGRAGHRCGRGRALALWDLAPRLPNASRDWNSPPGLVGVLVPHVSPGGRSVLPVGPSQSPTSDRRRCLLRWRRRPSSRGDGDVPGELPRCFPRAVPEGGGVLRLPTQLPPPGKTPAHLTPCRVARVSNARLSLGPRCHPEGRACTFT